MTPTPRASGNSWSNCGMEKGMALTKKGQRRAVDLRNQTANAHDIKRAKRAKNMALAKIKRTRH